MNGNLFAGIGGGKGREELLTTLAERPGVRVERIVSTGQASPPGFWYDQDWGEWVVLLTGAARLRLAEEAEARRLAPGDWVDIPAHCRHRVEWTDPDQPTVWLAVHYRDGTGGGSEFSRPASAAGRAGRPGRGW